MKVIDVMTPHPVTATPEMHLRDLARILTDRQISGVPVVDGASVVGVISEADLLVKELSRPLKRRLALEWLIGERDDPDELRRRAATVVREAMSVPAITISPDRPIREAATIMVDRRVNRLPVVEGGRLVGIVSRADLVKAYLRHDEDVRTAVRERVLRETMWLDPDRFTVDVREGVVHIAGTVDRRSTAGIVERLIGITDGVVELQSELRWEADDTELHPVGSGETEPGAASVTAREHPQPMHR